MKYGVYLVMSYYDGDVWELRNAYAGRGGLWGELVVCGVHVRHAAEIVDVPGEALECLGGIVASGGRRDPGVLPWVLRSSNNQNGEW